ncbi:heterokaryon incompatibility protein-domain-containing protein [Paraphoma chrysanthemicola]|nr:heterokaryon incompatibility protein-domain-containing protein [Paraphoma chrysanthemicola]
MIQTCLSSASHSACSGFNLEQQSLPTRVIDVGSGTNPPFLFITGGKVERYCTLSYCWGQCSTAYNTTRDNLVAHEKELPIVSPELKMPKTYHDAIVITRHLGVRYLWIDAICIVQDDPEDWRAEAAKMKDIYQNSYCTIAATGSMGDEKRVW